MAPTRKSRSVNKRFSHVNEASPSKDGDAKKSLQRVSFFFNLLQDVGNVKNNQRSLPINLMPCSHMLKWCLENLIFCKPSKK